MTADQDIRCLNQDELCQGPVDYWFTGGRLKGFPRCDYHGMKRQDQYENSMEKYADSDVAPDWFDPSYAGETW
jgi:hypothetical protein